MNVCPQFQSFNNGNWKSLEATQRAYAMRWVPFYLQSVQLQMINLIKQMMCKLCPGRIGGDETRSEYVRYIPVIQADVPARTMCRHGF